MAGAGSGNTFGKGEVESSILSGGTIFQKLRGHLVIGSEIRKHRGSTQPVLLARFSKSQAAL
jgi:hypothetical protein